MLCLSIKPDSIVAVTFGGETLIIRNLETRRVRLSFDGPRQIHVARDDCKTDADRHDAILDGQAARDNLTAGMERLFTEPRFGQPRNPALDDRPSVTAGTAAALVEEYQP